MSYRSRHRRWLRRMALGLAFASVMFAGRVSVAAAKVDVPYATSHQTPSMSPGMGTYGDSRELPEPFVASETDFPRVQVDSVDGAARPEPNNGGNWRFEWSDAFPLGASMGVLALVFGLALGHPRRPRLAGQ
jgi:membrane-associated phospholipid phosphatase